MFEPDANAHSGPLWAIFFDPRKVNYALCPKGRPPPPQNTDDDNDDCNDNYDGNFYDNDDKNDQKTYNYKGFRVKIYQF